MLVPGSSLTRLLRLRGFWPRAVVSVVLAGAGLASVAATAQTRLPPAVSAALQRAKVPAEAVSLLLADADGRATPRLSHRAAVPVQAASLMKLVTTTAALDTLGPAYVWRTPVYLEGTARQGTFYGNVYIQGRGDPQLVVERMWLLLRRLQGVDIRTIAGDIVLDRSAFDVAATDPGDFDGEPLRPYNASPDALLLNYKSLVMTFVPDRSAQAAHVNYEPPLAGVDLPTHVPLGETDCNDYRTSLRADFTDPTRIRFAGRYPASCGERTWPVAYADPVSYATRAVAGLWREMGGQLQGRVREGTVPSGLVPAFEVASPPLAELIRPINKFSNNVMAQQLFLTLGLERKGQGNYEAARAVVQDWWRERVGAGGEVGVVDDAPRLDNGSGLSRREFISAQALGRLLQYAWRSPLGPELAASLPLAGVDGTVRRLRGAGQGRAHLKSGSLRDVAGLAGYVHAANGRRYVLVAIVNHPNANAARPALEALVDWAVQLP